MKNDQSWCWHHKKKHTASVCVNSFICFRRVTYCVEDARFSRRWVANYPSAECWVGCTKVFNSTVSQKILSKTLPISACTLTCSTACCRCCASTLPHRTWAAPTGMSQLCRRAPLPPFQKKKKRMQHDDRLPHTQKKAAGRAWTHTYPVAFRKHPDPSEAACSTKVAATTADGVAM